MRSFVCMMLRSKKPNLLQNNNYKIYKACELNFLKFSRLSLGDLAKITFNKSTKKIQARENLFCERINYIFKTKHSLSEFKIF